MPKYTMRVQISGTRDGADWPRIGGQIELPDAEGKQLVKMGAALPGVVKLDGRGNPTEPIEETAVAPVAENAKARAPRGSAKKAAAEAAAAEAEAKAAAEAAAAEAEAKAAAEATESDAPEGADTEDTEE